MKFRFGVQHCQHCGSSLLGKRKDAKFCSPECRIAEHRQQKARAARREEIAPFLECSRFLMLLETAPEAAGYVEEIAMRSESTALLALDAVEAAVAAALMTNHTLRLEAAGDHTNYMTGPKRLEPWDEWTHD